MSNPKVRQDGRAQRIDCIFAGVNRTVGAGPDYSGGVVVKIHGSVPRCLCFMRQEGLRAMHDWMETRAAERECLRGLLNTAPRAALTATENWHRGQSY